MKNIYLSSVSDFKKNVEYSTGRFQLKNEKINKCCEVNQIHERSNIYSDIKDFRNRYLQRYLVLEYLLIKHKSFTFYIKDKLKTNEILLDKVGNEFIGEVGMDLDIEKSKFVVYPLKHVVSISEQVTTLGMLINNGEGQVLIEDPTHRVKIVISSKTLFGKGIYCFNHFVIARGKMNKITQSFHVDLMFHPPIQNVDKNVANEILSNLFSGTNNILLKSADREKNIKNQSLDKTKLFRTTKYLEDLRIKVQVSRSDYWVILSDILLTSMSVIKNLRKVFSGYEKMIKDSNINIGFILLGNFINIDLDKNGENWTEEKTCVENEQNFSNINEKGRSARLSAFNTNSRENHFKHSQNNFNTTRKGFERFKNVLKEFPVLLSNCNFFIISGPNDIGPDLLPKLPLSNYYASYLSKVLPDSKIHFISNPSVIDDSDIKIFCSRHSLTKELKEKTLFSYCGTKNVGFTTQWNIEPEILENIIPQTVLGQQHLTPTSSNIIPNLDYFLFLLPTPKILIIGDSSPSYSVKSMNQTWIVNPGSFNNTCSWVQYNVLTDSIDHVWL
ncbi:DNA polymerase alpha/epsilon subunit B family protein [Cryptosporidium meleagridis]|uniref:DNA polymerase II subunit 2 n=1 Tax=Cryptosporidium meleagridis TaxID=93969 RepID=A0A2P4Z5M6_9CRYT|nr:DNA polymerase alpha/epsilon subunit B family protein [Cryptosporidium meleagridis]